MSSIMSPVDDIDSLQFHQLPTKPINVTKAVRVGRVHVFVDAAGKVYSTQVMGSRCYTPASNLEDTLRGCKLLGVLSPEAVAQHKAYSKALREKRDRKYAAEDFLRSAQELGLRLTDAQKRAVSEAKE